MRRIVPCSTACGSQGDNLTLRYDPVQGPPAMIVVAEPYTKIGPVRACSHVVAIRRVRVGPCRCGNVEAPLTPNWPILNFDDFSGGWLGGGGGTGPCNGTGTTVRVDGFEQTDQSCYSPIIVDVMGGGFSLTNAAGGVNFDLDDDGTPERLSWTAADSGNGFLSLDRNGNGRVDSGTELFCNFTPQPASDRPNGFAALAEFDKLALGGNVDGTVDSQDAIFGCCGCGKTETTTVPRRRMR